MKPLLNWALSALAVWIVARLVPGFHVSGPLAALIAALVIGFVNATLGVFLKIVTFPLVLLTLGAVLAGDQCGHDRAGFGRGPRLPCGYFRRRLRGSNRVGPGQHVLPLAGGHGEKPELSRSVWRGAYVHPAGVVRLRARSLRLRSGQALWQ